MGRGYLSALVAGRAVLACAALDCGGLTETQTPSDVLDFSDWLLSEATIEEVEQLIANIQNRVYVVDDAIPEWENAGQFLSNVYIANVHPQGLQLAMRSALAARYDTVASAVRADIAKSGLYAL